MADQKFRVGIIGMGLYAATEHVPMLRETGRVEIVAASRRDAKRLELARRKLSIPQTFTDWREMLDKTELDAVVVATPHDTHLEPTLAALDRGLHVLLEKPLATSIADASAILNAVRKSDRVVMMGVTGGASQAGSPPNEPLPLERSARCARSARSCGSICASFGKRSRFPVRFRLARNFRNDENLHVGFPATRLLAN